MSYTFLLEQGEESSADSFSAIPAFALSSGMPTRGASYSLDSGTGHYRDFLSGMMSRRSTASRGAGVWMSSRAASRVRTYPQRAKAQASTESGRECGDIWPASLARYDRDMSLWKTHQCSLFADLTESPVTFPIWGMTRNGELFQRNMSGRLTSAEGYGYLRSLRLVKLPIKQKMGGFATGAGTMSCPGAGVTTENGNVTTAKSGRTRFIMTCGTVAHSVAPGMWLTPQANEDAAGTPNGKMQKMLGNHPLIRGETRQDWARGTLNPTWVEWLMGWPLGWTDCAASATDKYRQWRRSHGRR